MRGVLLKFQKQCDEEIGMAVSGACYSNYKSNVIRNWNAVSGACYSSCSRKVVKKLECYFRGVLQ